MNCGINIGAANIRAGTPGTPGTIGGTSVTSSMSTMSKADLFMKGIKWDIAHYKDFKSDKEWFIWHQGTYATAVSHGCENVMTEGYLPSNLGEVALFHRQNDFMFMVWITKVHTNIRKSLIAQHSMTRNAQAVAVGMVIYYQDSTAADLGK